MDCDGNAVEITDGADTASVTISAVAEGEATVSVTAASGDTEKTATFTVTVTKDEPQPEPTLDRIELTGPSKTEYIQGEEMDLSDLGVIAVYSDGTTEEIAEGYEVTGYDPNALGTQEVTVTYKGVSAVFTVTVKASEEPQPTLDRIELGGDVKTVYTQGEKLDLSGLTVTAVYSDESKVELKAGDYTVSGYDPNTVGEQNVTVTYGGLNSCLYSNSRGR